MTCWIDAPRSGFRYLLRDGCTVHVAGWAFVEAQAADRVAVVVDGQTVAEHVPAMPRPDVAAAHPTLADSAHRLGFEIDFAAAGLEPGAHTVAVVAQRRGCPPQRSAVIEFTAVSEDSLGTLAERFALVPDALIYKVNGSRSLELFENIGRLTVKTMRHYVTRSPLDRVFDFGCGLGRILIPFKQQCADARFTAFDIDAEMLRWAQFLCRDHAERYTLDTDGLDDASFDLVYAISVFTHLDTTTERWLGEIRRLLKPGGQAFITYHDETLFAEHAGTPFLPGTEKGETFEQRFVVGRGTDEGGAAMGTYYETAYWEDLLSRHFRVETTVSRGLLDYQSISVVRA